MTPDQHKIIAESFALSAFFFIFAAENYLLMYKKEGYWDVTPKIKRLSFPKRGKFQVDLQDGRSVTMPISAFPSLKKVPAKERENWYLMGGGVTWDSCSEVIHIEQILGNYQNYAHEQA